MTDKKWVHLLAATCLHQDLDDAALREIILADPRILTIAKRAPVNNAKGPFPASLLSRLHLRYYFLIFLVKDHNSLCRETAWLLPDIDPRPQRRHVGPGADPPTIHLQ